MCKTYHDIIEQIIKNEGFLENLEQRLQNCIGSASGFGWGVEDYMRHEYNRMMKHYRGVHTS